MHIHARRPERPPLRIAAVLLFTTALVGPGRVSVETLATNAPIPSAGRLGGVAIDAEGRIYVANFGADVWRVDVSGDATVLASGINGSSGNAFLGDALLQAEFVGNRVLRVEQDGTQSVYAETDLNGPVGIAVSADDDAYVCNCEGNSITRIAATGETSVLVASPEFNCPNGISVGPDGALYVVNYSDAKVLRVTPGGELELFATLPGTGNSHIVWAQGAFFVTKIADNKVYRLTLDGEAEWFAGSGETGLADGPLRTATLNAPNGIAVMPDESMLVLNNLRGQWKGKQPTEIVLRSIPLDVLATDAAPSDAGGSD